MSQLLNQKERQDKRQNNLKTQTTTEIQQQTVQQKYVKTTECLCLLNDTPLWQVNAHECAGRTDRQPDPEELIHSIFFNALPKNFVYKSFLQHPPQQPHSLPACQPVSLSAECPLYATNNNRRRGSDYAREHILKFKHGQAVFHIFLLHSSFSSCTALTLPLCKWR